MFLEEFGVRADAAVSPALASTIQDAQSLTESLSNDTELLGTIEAQLSQSPIYRRAVESLQQLTAEPGIDGQILLKAVSLEAVRLTLQAVNADTNAVVSGDPATIVAPIDIAQADVTQADVLPLETAQPVALLQSNLADDELLDNDVFEAIESVVHAEPAAGFNPANFNPFAGLLNRYKTQRQTAVAEVKVLTRTELLTQIGAQIQLEREQKGLSIAQLHARTFIPMYHLQALEGGHVEQLPEDVYLRGFLRRIENALGLPVSSLIDKLPNDVDASIVPCWSGHGSRGGKTFGGLDVNPNHLYATYAAIMAGGVCWLSNQTAPTTANLPDLSNYEPRAEVPAARQPQGQKPQANLASNKKSAQQSVKVGSTKNIAPPEVLR